MNALQRTNIRTFDDVRQSFQAVVDTGLARNNLNATRAPTVTDDFTDKWSIGSRWHYGMQVWMCIDPAKDAALWNEIVDATGVGPITNAACVGVGACVFKSPPAGSVLQFRSIVGAQAGLVTQGTNEITIDASQAVLGYVTGAGQVTALAAWHPTTANRVDDIANSSFLLGYTDLGTTAEISLIPNTASNVSGSLTIQASCANGTAQTTTLNLKAVTAGTNQSPTVNIIADRGATGTAAINLTSDNNISLTGASTGTITINPGTGGILLSDLTNNGILKVTNGTGLVASQAILTDLDDVTITGPSANDFLRYDVGGSGVWSNDVIVQADIFDWPLTVGRGGTGADLSATGGANQFVKQSSIGAAFTVGTIGTADLPTHTHAFSEINNIATDRLLGRDTAGTGIAELIPVGGGIEFTGGPGIQTSAFTGDATKTAGGTVLTLATVNANVGSFGTATQVGTFTVNGKGLITAASNTAIAITKSQVTDFAHDLLSASHADTIAGSVILGDLIIGGASVKWERLAANATSTRKFLRSVSSGLPAWDTLAAGDIPALVNVWVDSSNIGTRNRLNFISGTNVTISGVNDGGDGEIEITIDATGGVTAHNLLDGSVHPDTVAQGVTRGSIIYGNATPKWDELLIGASGRVLRSDGTDIAWAALTTTDVAEGSNLYFTDERAQDAVGTMVAAGVSLVYVDATPLLVRAALTGDVTAAQDSNATTLATVNANVGTFGSATQVGQFTVNAKGLITSATNVAIAITRSQVTDFAHKSTHVASQTDAFVKGDILDCEVRYLNDIADPASDNKRFWLVDAGSEIRYWDDLGTPAKRTLVATDLTQTLTNKTLTAPTIADFTNAVHDHQDADDGGQLVAAALLTTAGFTLFAKANTGAGTMTELAAGANTVLGRAGSADLAFGTIVTAQIGDDQVSLAKIANAAANSVLVGSGSAGTGTNYTEITLGTGLTMTGTVLSSTASGGHIIQEDGVDLAAEPRLNFGAGLLASDNAGVATNVVIDSTVVTLTGSQTLTNKTLTAPTIADFTNANHDHLDADDGGTLTAAAISNFNSSAQAASGWIDNGATVSLVTTTDDVFVGLAQINTAKFSVDGDTDQIQFSIQGHSTQTTSLVVWETSAGTDLMTFSNAGAMAITGSLTVDNLTMDVSTLSGSSTLRLQYAGANSISFQSDTADTDIRLTFAGTTNSGEYKWMEDEDYFEFLDHVMMSLGSDKALYLRATTNRLYSPATGEAVLEADTILYLGKEGDITLGTSVSTEYNIKAGTDNFYHLGISSQAWMDIALHRKINWYSTATVLGGYIDHDESNLLINASVGKVRIDNLQFDGNTIDVTNTNGNLNLSANGTGNVIIDGFGLNMDADTTGAIRFGEDQDAAIWYDGTNLNIDPNLVGSGKVVIDLITIDTQTIATTSGGLFLAPASIGEVVVEGQLQFRPGTSDGDWHAKASGIVKAVAGPVNNDAGGADKTLISVAVQANSLTVNGDAIEAHATVSVGAAAETKTFRVKFAGSTLFTQTTTLTSTTGTLHFFMMKDAANSVRWTAVFRVNGDTLAPVISKGTAAPTLTSDQTFEITGASTTASNATGEQMQVVYHPGV